MDGNRLLGRDELLRQVVGHLRSGRGVALSGVPWVGRTRLLREALARVDGDHVLCRPTAAGRGIPFAGLGPLAPARPDAPGTWLDEVRERVPEGAIVAVDGAQFLDAHSALLLFRAVEEGAVRVALSVWRGHPAPDAVTSLYTDGLVPLVDVDPLEREAADELVRDALGGPVAQPTLQQVWDRSRGFPLLMREMLLGSQEAGVLGERDGLWTADGPLAITSTLVAAARQVAADLSDEEQRGLELLSLGEPLRPDVMDRLVPVDVLERLEQQQLTHVDLERGGYVLPAPGWAEALAGTLSAVRRRVLLRELADAAPPLTELADAELVRVASWRVEAGLGGEGDRLAAAASHAAAHGRLEQARSLAEAAIPDAPVTGRLALADVLTRLDEHDGAVDVLDQVAQLPEGRTGEAAIAASRIRFFRQGRRDAAIAILRRQKGEHPPEVRPRLDAAEALLVALAGDLPSAVRIAEDVIRSTGVPARARIDAQMAAGLALTWHGRIGDGRETIRDALRSVRVVAGEADEHMLELILEMAEHYGGRPALALELGRDRYERALATDAAGLAAVWATQMSGTLLSCGRVDEALHRATEAVQLAERDDELTVLPLACAWAAMAAATAGDVPMAREWERRMVSTRQLEDARSRIQADRVAVAIRIAESDLEGAAELARSTGRAAEEAGHLVWALALLHEAVRAGYAELVAEDVDRVGRRVDGDWAATVVAHAQASTDRDLDALERVADRFAGLGFTLAAVEAYAEAARVASAMDRSSRSSVLRARARELRRLTPEAATPSLRGLGTEHLTKREREVALLAAEGLTSRAIAERLVVSPRTVDNHLASVYRKLDIAGRDDLALALGTGRS